MAQPTSLSPISQADYEAIEAAVMETARGRWFLAEFARRNRTADTQVLLDAIGRLEQAVAGQRATQSIDRLRFDLSEMAKAISVAKSEVAALRSASQEGSGLGAASEALDDIVRTTERATSDILDAAEHIQETAWTLREAGADPELCDDLDRRATEIYTACSFQDLTAQRTAKIIHTLRYLEGRVHAMIEIWGEGGNAEGSGPGPAPMSPDKGMSRTLDLDQSDVDLVIIGDDLFADEPVDAASQRLAPPAVSGAAGENDLALVEGPPASVPVPAPAAASLPPQVEVPAPLRPEAFADIDALGTSEKLRRFL